MKRSKRAGEGSNSHGGELKTESRYLPYSLAQYDKTIMYDLPTEEQLRSAIGGKKLKWTGEVELPSSEQLKDLLNKKIYRKQMDRTIRGIISALVTAAALAVLVAVLLLPVMRIYGSSMTPTLSEDNFVVSIKGSNFDSGDVIAFYYNNKILVKRVIAQAGQWVNIDEFGNVYVDDAMLNEPYVSNKSLGECDIELPFQVPEGRVFVMGDHRDVSVDSRSSAIGCVAEEQIVGKIVFCLWPFADIGKVE